MPFLDKIVSGLNAHWISSSLSFLPPYQVKAYGIAEPVIDVLEENGEQKQVKYPAIVDEFGEVTMITPDDSFSIMMFHRLDGIINGIAPKTGFGDNAGDQLETVNMSLVVFAFRRAVNKTANWLEAAFKDQMPDTSKQTSSDGKFLQSSVFRVGSSSFDKIALLSREYSEVALNYPDVILFELKYRIENTWRKGCFIKNCNC